MVSLYILASILLLLYSYTQVDLSLTLSKSSIYQLIEKKFQYVGWFNRPLSTELFVGVVLVFFILYMVSLRTKRLRIWYIILPIAGILIFSYPAFSYDLFNYMFDAKTVLVYHRIPYTVAPLDFSGVEPWLSFMHWTHIPSTFPPFWILLTLPMYLLGFGYFLGIMWSIKLLVAAGYVTASWFIYKILKDLDPEHAVRGVALFALNPLVIFESLVSSHFDVVMMSFAVASLYAYVHKKRIVSFLLLACSAATKIMTATLIPVFLLGWQRKLTLVVTFVGFFIFIVITKREIQPWYLMWFLPWVALLPRMKWLTTISVGVSMGYLLRYIPFLYTGGYNQPVPTVELWLVLVPTLLSILWVVVAQALFARAH